MRRSGLARAEGLGGDGAGVLAVSNLAGVSGVFSASAQLHREPAWPARAATAGKRATLGAAAPLRPCAAANRANGNTRDSSAVSGLSARTCPPARRQALLRRTVPWRRRPRVAARRCRNRRTSARAWHRPARTACSARQIGAIRQAGATIGSGRLRAGAECRARVHRPCRATGSGSCAVRALLEHAGDLLLQRAALIGQRGRHLESIGKTVEIRAGACALLGRAGAACAGWVIAVGRRPSAQIRRRVSGPSGRASGSGPACRPRSSYGWRLECPPCSAQTPIAAYS